MMHITEDTPPDMLAGAMDLTVHLPTGRSVKMSVERSTPMMDLLVQITTSQHLQLSGYIIQALGMAPSLEHSDKVLPYKPNTPIGALDTQHVRVVPKGRTLPTVRNAPPGHQPFESTFRLKVHLPRNQLYVCRVSRNVRLEEIMKKVCEEKNLDPLRYEFRHPGNLDEVLDPKLSLSDYQITEIYLTTKGTILTQAISSSDIMALRKEEERRQMAAKTGGGVFNLIFKRGKTSMGSGSVSSDNRSISPTQSDDSRSVTPPVLQKPSKPQAKPKPPARKRRPAPKPPQPPQQQQSQSEISSEPTKAESNGLTICHSRNSSDSSGYHEASLLSDNCTLPRKVKGAEEGEISGRHSRSVTNLSGMSAHSKSTSSLVHAGRKKKPAPPPPPVTHSASSVNSAEKPSPIVASQLPNSVETYVEPVNSAELQIVRNESKQVQLESGDHQESVSTAPALQSPRESINSPQPPSPTPSSPPSKALALAPTVNTNAQRENDVDPVHSNNTVNLILQNEEDKSKDIYNQEDDGFHDAHKELKAEDDVDDVDWQYQLPSPPTAFRDSSPDNFTDDSSFEPSSLVNLHSTDSVVTSPELFEKLYQMKDSQSENETNTVSDTSSSLNDEVCNKLSLEHLEKRKSLVYNRELSTSLKAPEETNESLTISRIANESEKVISDPPKQSGSQTTGLRKPVESSTLPNFVITTYDNPKKKIKVFEDDSVRSNERDKRSESLPRDSISAVAFRKHSLQNSEDGVFKKPESRFSKLHVDNFVARSGSFSTDNKMNPWKPLNPVKRSKSQLTVGKKNTDEVDDDGISRSNSLFDVSGLHSLEVMRKIQTKLNTPTNSAEELNDQEEKKQVPATEPKAPPKISHYRPPSINLSTWSERPKTNISVQEDTDYKMKNAPSKVIVNTETNNVSIKVNSSEPIVSQPSGNVIIKIGGDSSAECIYRKPLGTEQKPRPHSVAVTDQNSEVSRVPIVRSVELKKPFKDCQMNKSITQIYGADNDSFYKPNFALGNNSNFYVGTETKSVLRNYITPAPIVRGFRTDGGKDNRKSWGTFKKDEETLTTNKNVPFSQSSLKRTESNKTTTNVNNNLPFGNIVLRNAQSSIVKNNYRNSAPPEPPQMPKTANRAERPTRHTESFSDPRDELLSAIRNFGGKKGLKAVKV